MKIRTCSSNIYVCLLYRLLVIMFLFSLARIGFYLFNKDMLAEVTLSQFLLIMKGGVVFDLSAVLYINLLFILLSIIPFDIRYNHIWQTVLKYYYFVANGFALILNGADFVYFRFALKRSTAEVFKSFGNEEHVMKLGFRFMIDYWPVTLFTIALLLLMIFLYGRVKCVRPPARNRLLYFSLNLVLMFVSLVLIVGGIRGGFKHSTRPINISNAVKYSNSPDNVPVVLNTPFSIIRTANKRAKVLPDYHFYTDTQIDSLYNTCYRPDTTRSFQKKNVVIIILESFGKEYVGGMNKDLEGGKYEGYTPFLDSLISVGLTFDVSLANGRKSIDALPSILASVPSLEVPYIISPYSNNKINGIAGLLKKKGYYTAFFHGAANGSMGFDSFTKMAGFEHYFGLNEFRDKDQYDGMWGVWDEPFLKFFADSLSHFKEPFVASVFTLSSHHPFKVPEQYAGRFKKGPVPVLETIGYTDYALRKFFNEVSDKPWFKNTLFVITADHANEPVLEEYNNDYGKYSVPIVFYEYGSDLHGVRKRIAQQIDIMPTVLNYLKYDEDYISFGNDLLSDSGESFGFNTPHNNYHLYSGDYLLVMEGDHVAAIYNYKTDRLLSENLLGKDQALQQKMEEKVKAIMQVYSYRLKYNKMTVNNLKTAG